MDFHGNEDVRTCLDIRLEVNPTVQSQYSASKTIVTLAQFGRVNILPHVDIGTFFVNIFDIETARGVGLDIWGRILGIGRDLYIPDNPECFGFLGSDDYPFDQRPFWDGENGLKKYTLTDEAYRSLLMWKALANIASADAATLNNLLHALFHGRDIVVYETGIMAIELYIYFPLEPWERAILENYGLMAKGAGVELNWTEIPYPCFGFYEAGFEPFDVAPFWNGPKK